ncbi:MAG: arylsulfatase [Betaproteobacteria bacterium]
MTNSVQASAFGGTIGRTLADSTPWWPPRARAPQGAPNVIVILLDDLGYADLGCFGGEIATPAIDALAAQGLRFANYTTVPMCTPARAALLTGKNPHAVGCGWLTFNDPGYPGYRAGEIAQDAPTFAELLRAHGYSTYAVGKWHNTAEPEVSPAGDRRSWPLQRGFDRFYGFIGGETHYFSPAQLFEDNAIVARDTYPDDYFCSDDWTDKAIGWLGTHVAVAPDKPFFLYLAHNAPHAPLHAKADDLARYAGRYDAGWDAMRAARHRRQVEAGLVPAHWPLAPRSDGVPAWSDTDPTRRGLLAHYMALYAALVDNLDQNIGRVTTYLRDAGILDNTLVIVTSDNGANGIGGVDGAANNLAKRLSRSEDPARVKSMLAAGALGGPASWPVYPLGWTDVSSTPFRLYKTTTMNGGIRVPMVVHWPAGIAAQGAVRTQWLHVTDLLPTVLDVVGAAYPASFNGCATRGLDGHSFAPMLADADAPGVRDRQHYELAGNRGYILGCWKIVSLQPPGRPIELDNWMLFDLDADGTETRDLAAMQPDKLAELVAAFEADAIANAVYPLDNRDIRRALTVAPDRADAIDRARRFRPGRETVALSVIAPMLADRDFQLDCRFRHLAGGAGVIFAIGDPIAGFALFARDDALHFVYNGGTGAPVVATLALTAGVHDFRLDFRAIGARRGEAQLAIDGVTRGAALDLSPTLILGWVGEGLDIGIDRKQHVTPLYGVSTTFAYAGSVDHLRIKPGAQAPDSYANRPERLAQRDPPSR